MTALRRTVPLVLLLVSLPAAPARADDTSLLNRITPAPNVLIILDTSQSMTWYRYTGSTRGDEYPGWTGDNTPMARMAMAKSTLSTVVDTYFSNLRLGLASYAEGGTPANPNALVRIKQYHYYCTKTGTYCTNATNPNPPRQYFTISPGTAGSPLQLWRDSTNLNMPAQNTFTLNWALDPGVSNNPQMNTNTSGGGSPYTVCRWTYTQTNYNHSGQVTGTSTGTLDTNTPCPAIGTQRTLTETESFNFFNAGDDPTPWKYRLIRAWSGGTALFSAGCAGPGGCSTQYASNQGSGWTNYNRVYTFSQQVTITPPPPTTTYSWTYFYKGSCTDGCSGYLTTSRTTASQSTTSPVPPSPLAVPFTRVYTWSGNNYEMNPPSAENSCPAGTGISVLVDPGGAPDKNTLKNYFGTGPDKKKELHGANYYTPLATSLDSVRQYFLNSNGAVQQDPLKDCRRNFVILITDGGESCALVPLAGPGSPGSMAQALQDAQVNAFGGVPTYVVALDGGNFSASEQAVLADIAAKGSQDGLGTFYSASSPNTLLQALNAIIGSILAQQYSFVSPVLPSLRTADNLMLIQASLMTPASPPADPNAPLWQGVLEAFPLDSLGNLLIDQQQIVENHLWEAGELLRNRLSSTRTITTVAGGSQVPFAATDPVRAALAVSQDLTGDSVIDNADADLVIAVVRGNQGAGANMSFLGDIFHSTPIIVGAPPATYADRTFDPAQPDQILSLAAAPDTFAPFRIAQATRQRVAIVGTNAGQLHAFNAGTWDAVLQKYNTGDGGEVWAFIPPQMLPKLQALAHNGGHQYFADGSPRVADVWIDANNDGVKAADGSEWRTILVGGFRQGGTGLYALDVTNTASPQFLWTYATTGQSWSEPAFGKVKVQIGGREVDRWVVFAGDGYDPTGVAGRKVHVIDLQTGRALWQYATNAPVAGSPMAVNLGIVGGYVDRVYVGTTGGEIIRLDVSAVGTANGGDVNPASNVMVTNWSGGVFFSAGAAQPFYTKVAATVDPKGNLWLFFGSGDRSDPQLVPATANRIYGVKDPYPNSTATLTEADLTNMTTNNTLDATAVTGAGWYVILRPGEKEWADASLVFNQQVFFTTYTPGSTTCGDVGSGAVYMVYYLTGGGVTNTALFQANPPVASSRIYQVNAGATAKPVLTTGVQGANAKVYLGTSNMLTLTPTFSTPTSIRSTRYWRRILP
jgi:hypothetical protein